MTAIRKDSNDDRVVDPTFIPQTIQDKIDAVREGTDDNIIIIDDDTKKIYIIG